MATHLTPDYVNIDFSTIKERIISELQTSSEFKDYNYEGSNIAVLIELISYLGELNVYYLNKIAKNCFIDTADIYENVHRISSLMGYKPKGYISSSTTLSITVSGSEDLRGRTLRIEPWTSFSSSNIKFLTLDTFDYEVPEGDVEVKTVALTGIEVIQGEVENLSYSGSEIIDYRIILPFHQYNHSDDIVSSGNTVVLEVGSTQWERISDFYDSLSGLYTEENVYTFEYNKYGQSIINFSYLRNSPSKDDTITIRLVKTLGEDGNVGPNTIVAADDYSDTVYLSNISGGNYTALIATNIVSITNPTAAIGGSDPETIPTIKQNSKEILHSQYRNVTKRDYEAYLESHPEVEKASVWGEQEMNPDGGNINDYNKVYISVIPNGTPDQWTSKLDTNSVTVSDQTGVVIYQPVDGGYDSSYINTLATYLEPRKMLCAYEEYVAPELIYFSFNLGLKVKRRLYKYNSVKVAVQEKLKYYFSTSYRDFGDTISFTDMQTFLLDSSITSDEYNFETNIKGLDNLVIRDIKFYDFATSSWLDPYSYNESLVIYPRFASEIGSIWDENQLRNIELAFSQFPMLVIEYCEFEQES